MIKLTIVAAFAAVAMTIALGTASACSPAPSCWMGLGNGYVRTLCRDFAKDRQTLKQIAENVEEPEKIEAFGRACKRLGITLKAK